jgi:hypothetical protein
MTAQSRAIGEAVADSIVAKRMQIMEKAGAKFPRLIRELVSIAFSDIANYVTVSDDGSLTCIPTQNITKPKRAAIKKIKEHTRITESADGEKIWKDSRIEYELYDKLSAITTLLKLRDDFPAERSEVTGLNGGPIEFSRLDRANRIAAIAEAARKRKKAQGGKKT